MFRRFYPRQYLASAYDIPYERFREKGVRGVIFDIDNTLVPHDAPADGRARELFAHLRGLGFDTCLLSNNKEGRVAEFAGQVGSRYIFKAGKPSVKGYERAMEEMGRAPAQTAIIGDQIFTVILGGNLAGITTLLIRPIRLAGNPGRYLRYAVETPFRLAAQDRGGL